MNILQCLVDYMAEKTTLVGGTNLFYNEMPDDPTKCLTFIALKHPIAVPTQIDADVYVVQVVARDDTSTNAFALAKTCYQWLRSSEANYNANTQETTGFINLTSTVEALINLNSTPIWEKTDQRGRRYYTFTATIITKRLI